MIWLAGRAVVRMIIKTIYYYELVARVRIHIKEENRKNNKEICTKNLIINVSNHQEILIEEETISLTKREFTIYIL